MACKAVLAKYFINLPSRRLLAVRLAISSHIFFAVVTSRNLFYFLLSNVMDQGTRHLVAGTLHPIVGALLALFVVLRFGP